MPCTPSTDGADRSFPQSGSTALFKFVATGPAMGPRVNGILLLPLIFNGRPVEAQVCLVGWLKGQQVSRQSLCQDVWPNLVCISRVVLTFRFDWDAYKIGRASHCKVVDGVHEKEWME